jgi:4-amino-4-deoxy-L-arabinose transferase-like glycosyltransferase
MACRKISVMPETKVHSCPHYAMVVLLLSLAIFLRLFKLGQSPPGLNQDEAAGAWNAYCLLKTGTDQHGVSWPIFYLCELGGPTSTLYVYSMIPFQAVGGMNIYTTRLPSVFAGVLSVILIYFTGNCSTGKQALSRRRFLP